MRDAGMAPQGGLRAGSRGAWTWQRSRRSVTKVCARGRTEPPARVTGMRIGVLGTGVVGRTLAGKLVELGHEVRMGSRQAGNEVALEWVQSAGENASEGAFADAAQFGELVINATAGGASLEALGAAGAENLAGKVLVDVANALDFSGGPPPLVGVSIDDSLGERIQAAFPETRVVKALNTMNA